jgi:1,4-alpha-glucan branching enzyme
MVRIWKIFGLLLGIPGLLTGQILDVTPAFPTQQDVVTILYDATKGNGALNGVSPVYAHAGLITQASTSPSDWKHVKGTWGSADPTVLMDNLGNNIHRIVIDLATFYGYPQNTIVQQMAFVFRNASGNVVGRSSDGSDIYYPVYPNNAGLLGRFFSPDGLAVLEPGDTLPVVAKTNQAANLTLYDNGQVLVQLTGMQELNHTLTAQTPGNHMLVFEAVQGQNTVTDTLHYVVVGNPVIAAAPAGSSYGLTLLNDSTVLFKLYAPHKHHVFVLGDFNQFIPNANYLMHLSPDSTTWWLEVGGLTPQQRYGYQFLYDGVLRLADPLSTLIADPANDGNISATIYPNPYPYPTGKTSGFISLFQTGMPSFDWQYDSVAMPQNKDLIIYEILVRDFLASHSYLDLIDTLDYIQRLGVNAIELMPPGEFENNESWGYNPSFHMALDKYYGTPEHFKAFIDECHRRGIAVIFDIVLNHTFGQSPMVNMYWDATQNRPSSENPWFNSICPHEPYCWGFDLDHTRQATRDYVLQVCRYWLEEYHLDGFRFDYTKGLTNNGNGFDAFRIQYLKNLGDSLWALDPDAYLILEHWADNAEETQLANHGFMLWGNLTHDWHDAMMGYTGNLNNSLYTQRGWTNPHLVHYIESHDEERGMYRCLKFGDQSNPQHNIQDTSIALARAQAAAALFLTIPGPKMIWQFGELGYDVSIDVPCRVCNKPIRWGYQNDARRQALYNVYRSALWARSQYSGLQTLNVAATLNGDVKRVRFNDSLMPAISMVNFDVETRMAYPIFHENGVWYEYYSGDSLVVTEPMQAVEFKAGDFKLFLKQRLVPPVEIVPLTAEEFNHSDAAWHIHPNPAQGFIHVHPHPVAGSRIVLLDLHGRTIKEIIVQEHNEPISIEELKAGLYLLQLMSPSGEFKGMQRLIIGE